MEEEQLDPEIAFILWSIEEYGIINKAIYDNVDVTLIEQLDITNTHPILCSEGKSNYIALLSIINAIDYVIHNTNYDINLRIWIAHQYALVAYYINKLNIR